jgi:uncharacterized protein (TIGR00369 family)
MTTPSAGPDGRGYIQLPAFTWDQRCFGCGSGNPYGLKMQFHRKDDEVASWIRIPEHLCGWGGLVHGGVIATILDEVMSWTAIHLARRLILTQSMQVAFLKPIHTGQTIKAAGKMEARLSERKATCSAQIVDDTGSCCARGQGVFALFTASAGRRMKIIDPAIIDGFERFLSAPPAADPSPPRQQD